ncbi:MAG: helix-turn-helix transcriptional regulator [Acidimicrobiaceae bacterium]|nr:helix-turn-helix transcriptional regulator [Acidimicrobiaceae bacterium]
MLRAKDTIDRRWSEPLDIEALASMSAMSPAHFIRTFRATFGETPHRYLQRRRIERAMYLLRASDAPILDICLQVGFGSLGTFGRTFRAVVGETPTAHRSRGPLPAVPNCFVMTWTRPSSFGEAAAQRTP